jgi:hypothetical protein
MPEDAPYAVPTLDDFSAWYALQVVSVEGAQFGALSTAVNDALGWAKGTLVDPAVSTITGFVADIGLKVWHVLMGGLGFVLKWAYSFLRSFLLGYVPATERLRFPEVASITGADPLFLLSLIVFLLFMSVVGRVGDYAAWTWANVQTGLGYVPRGFANLWDSIESRLGAWSNWVWVQLSSLLGVTARGFATVFDAIESRLGAWSNWVWVQVAAAIAAVPGLPGTLLNSITSIVSNSATWLLTQFKAAIGAIPGVPGNLLSYITDAANAAANWLWVKVQAAIGAIPGLPGNLLGLITAAITASVSWLWDTFTSGNWIFGPVGIALGELLGFRVTSSAQWLWDNIRPRLEAIAGALVTGAASVFEGLLDVLTGSFRWVIDHAAEPFTDFLGEKLAIIGRVGNMEYATMGEALEALLDPPVGVMNSILGLILTPLIMAAMLASVSSAIGVVYAMPVIQDYNAAHGRNIPPATLLIQLLRRGLISESEAALALRRAGYGGEWIGALLATQEVLPSVSDMIRMGVREAFSPEIAGAFGQYEDLPPGLVEWAKKIGLSEEWAGRFWAAHWSLPSTEQMFEMFHRGVIDRETLLLGLRSADVMPFWRSNLEQIAYRIVGRVDIRRMYQSGAISIDRVKQTYLDQGYSPADAAALTEWVRVTYQPGGEDSAVKRKDLAESAIKQAYARRLITRDAALEQLMELGYNEEEADFVLSIWDFDFFQNPDWRSDVNPKQLTRSVIEEAYARGLIDANAAAAQLEELGFTPEDAALLLQLVDLKTSTDTADLEAAIAIEQFRAAVIDEAQLAASLRDLEIPEARIELLVQRETLRRRVKTSRLTQGQLQRAYRADIIDQATYEARLDALGYNETDVGILLALGAAA